MMPPIPLYEGTRPYQTIPFQWSLRTVGGDGVLNHKEYRDEDIEAFITAGIRSSTSQESA
jgi:hypothetical protein